MKNLIKQGSTLAVRVLAIAATLMITLGSMPSQSHAALDSAGTEFWLAFEDNYDNGGYRRIFITSKVNTTGTVSAPSVAFSQAFTVTANTVTFVDLPVSVSNLGNGTVTNKFR